MDIFNKKYVRFIWEDELNGKECFVADDIDTLKELVNSDKSITYEIEKNPDGIGFKGTVDERTWNFAYYDPSYYIKSQRYFTPEEQKEYRKALNKIFKPTGQYLFNVSVEQVEKDFETWWQKATMEYTMPKDVNKHWCKLAFMAARGV